MCYEIWHTFKTMVGLYSKNANKKTEMGARVPILLDSDSSPTHLDSDSTRADSTYGTRMDSAIGQAADSIKVYLTSNATPLK